MRPGAKSVARTAVVAVFQMLLSFLFQSSSLFFSFLFFFSNAERSKRDKESNQEYILLYLAFQDVTQNFNEKRYLVYSLKSRRLSTNSEK